MSAVDSEAVEQLSRDFADVRQRAERVATEKIREAQLYGSVVGVILAAVITAVAGLVSQLPVKSVETKVEDVRRELDTLKAQADRDRALTTLGARLDTLSIRMTRLEHQSR